MISSSEMRRSTSQQEKSSTLPEQPDGKLFILTKGRVRLYKMEASREFTLEVVDAGTVFGEVAFTPHAFRESYAEAMEPSCRDRDGACRGGAPDPSEAQGRHQDN